jgi:hypothetical protein
MNEYERKHLKATVFELRFEEIAESAKLGTERPGVLLKQAIELDALVQKELRKPSKLVMLPYKRLERSLPHLISFIAVQSIQKDVD